MAGPSERAIEGAINLLAGSPGLFQRLVEEVVEVEFPDFFSSLTPRGRTSSDVAIRGWPDIVNSAHGAEATLSADWRAHLRADMKKAQTNAQLTSFVFVAWAKEPASDEQDEFRQQIHFSMEIPKDRVVLIFREKLRRLLTKPRFARLWMGILNLPSSSFPFLLIRSEPKPGDPANRLFGAPELAASFLPTRDEYLSGKVHRPAIADAVEMHLAKEGWALVRGRGAAGKSVFALNICFAPRRGTAAAYYLDFLDFSDSSNSAVQGNLYDVVASRSDRGVLFVVDNVHLNERLGAELLSHWREVGNGSQLILLGRDQASAPDAFGRLPPLAGVSHFALEVDTHDLLGVYRRIASKHTTLEPTTEILTRWLRLFKGDLIAFSAAVHDRCTALAANDWHLDATHAAEYVRAAYLEGLGNRECQNLMRLSASFAMHLTLPAEATDAEDFELSTRRRIVYKIAKGDARFFTLVHEGIGELILTAAQRDKDRVLILCEIAERSPARGFLYARGFQLEGKLLESAAIIRAIVENSKWPQGTKGLQDLLLHIEAIETLGVLTSDQIRDKLSANFDQVAQIALATPFGQLGSCLTTLESQFSALTRKIISHLSSPEPLAMLVKRASGRELPAAIAFLRYVEQEPTLAAFGQNFSKSLFATGVVTRLGDTLKKGNPGQLPSVLNYLGQYFQTSLTEIEDFLIEDNNITEIVSYCSTMDLGVVLNLLANRRVGLSIARRIDRVAWSEMRLQEKAKSATVVSRLAATLRDLRAIDLIEAPARGVIRASLKEDWNFQSLTIRQVLEIAKLGRNEGAKNIEYFLDRCLAGRANETAINIPELYAICEFILGLHVADESGGRRPTFPKPAIDALKREIVDLNRSSMTESALVHALLGVAYVVGVDISALAVESLEQDQLTDLLEFEAHKAIGNRREWSFVLFWAGLRELVRLRGDQVKVPRRAGLHAVRALTNARHLGLIEPVRVELLNWLNMCGGAGWKLVRDTPGIPRGEV